MVDPARRWYSTSPNQHCREEVDPDPDEEHPDDAPRPVLEPLRRLHRAPHLRDPGHHDQRERDHRQSGRDGKDRRYPERVRGPERQRDEHRKEEHRREGAEGQCEEHAEDETSREPPVGDPLLECGKPPAAAPKGGERDEIEHHDPDHDQQRADEHLAPGLEEERDPLNGEPEGHNRCGDADVDDHPPRAVERPGEEGLPRVTDPAGKVTDRGDVRRERTGREGHHQPDEERGDEGNTARPHRLHEPHQAHCEKSPARRIPISVLRYCMNPGLSLSLYQTRVSSSLENPPWSS